MSTQLQQSVIFAQNGGFS